MAPPSRKSPTPSSASFIDQSLQSFNTAELTDIIRIAQRLLKAKVQKARADSADGTQRWRFWDKPLPLDWNSSGLPKIQFPGPKGDLPEAEADWRVFDLLKGSAAEPLQVDWEVLEMLSPKDKVKETEVDWSVFQWLAEPEEEPGLDLSAVDWSGDRLPHLKVWTPPARRPGCPGRVRTGKHHRAIAPRRRIGTASENPDLAKTVTPTARGPSVLTKKATPLPLKARLSACRMPSRMIHQPGGGGR